MRRTITTIAVAVFLFAGCQRDDGALPPRQPHGEQPAVEADQTGLQGEWIEPHALAKEKPRGKGDYYVWIFSETKVTWRFHNTVDGKPIDAKIIHTGTFKINPATNPKRIDFDWGDGKTCPAIFELNGDTLKLNTGGTQRPKDFEDGEIFILTRQRKN